MTNSGGIACCLFRTVGENLTSWVVGSGSVGELVRLGRREEGVSNCHLVAWGACALQAGAINAT